MHVSVTDTGPDALQTLVPQVATGSRSAIDALCKALGADALYAFVYDGELGILVPAPGFPASVPAVEGWAELLSARSDHQSEAVFEQDLPYPTLTERTSAVVLSRSQGQVVILGNGLRQPQMAEFVPLAALLLQALTAAHATVVARAAAASTRTLLQDADRNQGQLDQALRSLQKTMREAASSQARIDLLRQVAEQLLGSEPASSCLPDVGRRLFEQLRIPVRLYHEPSTSSASPAAAEPAVSFIRFPLRSELHPDLGVLRAEFDSSAALHPRDHELLEAIAGQYAMALGREEMERQLAQTAHALGESMRLREEFLSVAAHELRNPIHIISGFAGVLQKEMNRLAAGEGSPVITEALDYIVRSASQMTSVVDGFLDISRMERGTLVLDHSLTDLEATLELAISEVRSEPAFQEHEVSVEVQQSVHFICDPLRLNQALVNLLSNAVKYSPRGSTVTVSACENSQDLEIRICDQGIGIDPEEQNRVFNPFVRGERAAAFAPGTGVGLFVTRKIVEAHGGSIVLSSHGGGGTAATLKIPRVPPGFDDDAPE